GITEKTVYNQKHTVAKMKYIDLKMVRMLASQDVFSKAEDLLRSVRANILSAANERVEASLDIDKETFKIFIQKNEEKNFDTSCTCDEAEHVLCSHKTFLFLQLLN